MDAAVGVLVSALTWSWDYFFVPQNQSTPEGTGFGTFSAIHLGVLAVLAICIAALPGEAQEGFALLEVALPSLLNRTAG